MQPKKIAVGVVQAIQLKSIVLSNPAQGKAAGNMVANEVNNQGAGDDGEHTGSGQHAPI